MSEDTDVKDDATGDVIELVAIERGFLMNRMVHPGEVFRFRAKKADGSPRKLPKWAALKGTPIPPRPVAGDLKPKGAQKAVKAKAGQLSGNDLA
jgi:hypothetical protein